MQNLKEVQRHVESLRECCPACPPRVAIILGTGLGDVVSKMQDTVTVPFSELPGFPMPTGDSHRGCFVFGTLNGVPAVVQQGRCHLYEGYSPDEVCTGVRVMRLLGAESLVITNAAGALNPQFDTGSLMLITDHVNMTGRSPLTGPNCDAWGPRFPDMSKVYDDAYISAALTHGARLGLRVERGVYLCTPGPQLETPAETRAFRILGADAVGMSTVPECIAAHHMGMRILGISCLTNKNLPDCMAPTGIEEIVAAAEKAGDGLGNLICAVLPDL